MSIIKAVEHSNTREVDRLMWLSPDLKKELSTKNGSMETPLMVCARLRRLGIARIILETMISHGYDPEDEVFGVIEALDIAVENGDIAMVRLLQSHIKVRGLWYRVVHEGVKMTTSMLKEVIMNDPNSIIHSVVRREMADTLVQLLQLGGDPNYEDDDGETLLIRAVSNRDVRIVEILLEHGANPNEEYIEVFYGDTDYDDMYIYRYPLMQAVIGNDVSHTIIRLLLQYGADVNTTSYHIRKGFTPIMIAAERDDWLAVSILLCYNPDLTITNRKGKTIYDLNLSGRIRKLLPPIRKKESLFTKSSSIPRNYSDMVCEVIV